ncbi:MAG: hypothetical protein L6R38_009650 [Xanthoria sp. 2 TBL-2021]|nr:MAG: hypothetical protein L6R38_009650 [Xanthoria sp. 2 TBL-2021]
MKFTIATSIALLLPLAIAQSSGAAGANTNAVGGQMKQPGAGANGTTTDSSATSGDLKKAGADKATSGSSAGSEDLPTAAEGGEDASSPIPSPSPIPSGMPGDIPAADQPDQGSGTGMDYMKTGADIPAAGTATGSQPGRGSGTGMDQAKTGGDSDMGKTLVVQERRYEENGKRRIEFKIEFGESNVYQTWEIRDGKLNEVPEAMGGSAMSSSKSVSSGGSSGAPSGAMGGAGKYGTSASTNNGTSATAFDDLTSGSSSSSSSSATGGKADSKSPTVTKSSANKPDDTLQVDYPSASGTGSNLAPLGGNQTDVIMGTVEGASDDNPRSGSPARPPTSNNGGAKSAGDAASKPAGDAAAKYDGNKQAKPDAAGSTGSKLKSKRSGGRSGKTRRAN